jgi:hypothetical protein
MAGKVIVSVLIAMSLLATVTGEMRAAAREVHVSVNFVECPAGASQPSILKAWVRDLKTHKIVIDQSEPASKAALETMAFSLMPGAYDILVHSEYCSQEIQLLIPGQQRLSLTLFGKRAVTILEGAGAISGTLPFDGVTVAIVYKGTAAGPAAAGSPDGFYQVPAIVNDRWYYAANVPAGAMATLRVYDGSHVRWIDVATVKVNPKSTARRYIEMDVTANSLGNATIEGY